MEKIVVSAGEVANVAGAPKNETPTPASEGRSVRWWHVLALTPLVAMLPVLCLTALFVRVGVRNRPAPVREAWMGLFQTLLIISGLFNSMAAVVTFYMRPVAPQYSFGLQSLDTIEEFPALPTSDAMRATQVAANLSQLVFVAAPEPDQRGLWGRHLETAAIGTAVLISAGTDGYLVATSRHVIDGANWLRTESSVENFLLFSKIGDSGHADVVARHTELDLALLWLPRRFGEAEFRQPVGRFREVPDGEAVYVIGHPQRLYFSIAGGLVSRSDGSQLQISAPVSPGNSGGPVYNEMGVLLGIVSSVVDKNHNPNAENLSFAVRADALLSADGWVYADGGEQKHEDFLDNVAEDEKEEPAGSM
jgi:S1-C subfamily serine protease